jgi:hypothetical protein
LPTRPSRRIARANRANCEALRFVAFLGGVRAVAADGQKLADANYALLKRDPHHPSLKFKKVGRYWSVRIGLRYRALAVDTEGGCLWFWIGSHAEYDRLIG